MSANEVVPGLWLGDWQDALAFEGERLCVLEGSVSYPGMTAQIPILVSVPAPHGPWPFHASREQLAKCAVFIEQKQLSGIRLLVHCAAGIERSPLAVAYWLAKSKRHSTLKAAYGHLMLVRPIVQDRTEWLEPGEPL